MREAALAAMRWLPRSQAERAPSSRVRSAVASESHCCRSICNPPFRDRGAKPGPGRGGGRPREGQRGLPLTGYAPGAGEGTAVRPYRAIIEQMFMKFHEKGCKKPPEGGGEKFFQLPLPRAGKCAIIAVLSGGPREAARVDGRAGGETPGSDRKPGFPFCPGAGGGMGRREGKGEQPPCMRRQRGTRGSTSPKG